MTTILQEMNLWNADSRALSILNGLSFPPEFIKSRTKDLSGGWRMRSESCVVLGWC
jgi:ATPase subunit of ABC transporter with duplicated ATPase domains